MINNNSAMILAPNKRQVITWTNDDPVHWHIYASLDPNELKTNDDQNRRRIIAVPKSNSFAGKSRQSLTARD